MRLSFDSISSILLAKCEQNKKHPHESSPASTVEGSSQARMSRLLWCCSTVRGVGLPAGERANPVDIDQSSFDQYHEFRLLAIVRSTRG